MSYTENVEVIPQMNERRALRYAVGAMLCWLLVMYAVGAKLALYHQGQPGAKSVAATKAWQDNAIAAVDVRIAPVQMAPVHIATPVFSMIAALLSMAVATIWSIVPDRPAMAVARGFSPHLSVRPPPTL